jgi:hypothetical protein
MLDVPHLAAPARAPIPDLRRPGRFAARASP